MLPAPTPVVVTTGRYEVYCTGVRLFLTKIDGSPAPGKLVLLSYQADMASGRYFEHGKWSDARVFPDGCIHGEQCRSIADGKVWIDPMVTSGAKDTPPKHISGKYEIDLSGKHLEGTFVAKYQGSKHPLQFCM
jgi:hypothetical protein